MWFRRPSEPDPLGPGPLRCAYCVSDYLNWERDTEHAPVPPTVHQAVTVLPATVEGFEGGAAICLIHARPLLRTRQLMARRRAVSEIRPGNGLTVAQETAAVVAMPRGHRPA